jgi:hypothetical protein
MVSPVGATPLCLTAIRKTLFIWSSAPKIGARPFPKTCKPVFGPTSQPFARRIKTFVHAIGGMEDHVHILMQLPPTLAEAQAILLIKSYSSKWMGRDFTWQKGYGAFSVSASNVPAVIRYIENQERHHRKRTFDQEFIAMLKKHGVAFDPKYVFG